MKSGWELGKDWEWIGNEEMSTQNLNHSPNEKHSVLPSEARTEKRLAKASESMERKISEGDDW